MPEDVDAVLITANWDPAADDTAGTRLGAATWTVPVALNTDAGLWSTRMTADQPASDNANAMSVLGNHLNAVPSTGGNELSADAGLEAFFTVNLFGNLP